jgi:hypothetical protein
MVTPDVAQEPRSWRELAIACVPPDAACLERGTSYKQAQECLRSNRRRLERHGWRFIRERQPGGMVRIVGVLQPGEGNGETAAEAQAARQLRSRCGHRLGARGD